MARFSAEAVKAAKSRGLDLWTYGLKGERLALRQRNDTAEGQRLSLVVDGTAHEVFLPLAGDFQALNALAALGIVMASGVDGCGRCWRAGASVDR